MSSTKYHTSQSAKTLEDLGKLLPKGTMIMFSKQNFEVVSTKLQNFTNKLVITTTKRTIVVTLSEISKITILTPISNYSKNAKKNAAEKLNTYQKLHFSKEVNNKSDELSEIVEDLMPLADVKSNTKVRYTKEDDVIIQNYSIKEAAKLLNRSETSVAMRRSYLLKRNKIEKRPVGKTSRTKLNKLEQLQIGQLVENKLNSVEAVIVDKFSNSIKIQIVKGGDSMFRCGDIRVVYNIHAWSAIKSISY